MICLYSSDFAIEFQAHCDLFLRILNLNLGYFPGGHTAELLILMSAFTQQFGYRIYIVSDTDKLSELKVKYL